MKKLIFLLGVVLAMAGCASTGLSSADRLALYQAHAGAPVGSFRLTTSFRWTPLSDDMLAVWTGANQGHLLELRSRCSGLTFANAINITNSMNTVTARFDSVQPRSTPGAPQQSCRIWTIRPLDGRALNDAKRELREAQAIEREAGVTEATE